jgi:hypothetical protein
MFITVTSSSCKAWLDRQAALGGDAQLKARKRRPRHTGASRISMEACWISHRPAARGDRSGNHDRGPTTSGCCRWAGSPPTSSGPTWTRSAGRALCWTRSLRRGLPTRSPSSRARCRWPAGLCARPREQHLGLFEAADPLPLWQFELRFWLAVPHRIGGWSTLAATTMRCWRRRTTSRSPPRGSAVVPPSTRRCSSSAAGDGARSCGAGSGGRQPPLHGAGRSRPALLSSGQHQLSSRGPPEGSLDHD